MRVTIVVEQRFDRTPNGEVWTRTSFPHRFWSRYLEVFDDVQVVARVREIASVTEDYTRSDGESVSFLAIPYYLGPMQYLAKAREVLSTMRSGVRMGEAVILRAPSQLSTNLESLMRRRGQPYGVEVVGDPHEVFGPGAVRHPLRGFFRRWFPRQLRRQCYGASAVAYVTRGALQKHYPAAPGAFTTHYSSIQLHDSAFVERPRAGCADGPFALVMVASLEQMYKAPDVLLRAMADCVAQGLDLRLSLIGDGKHRPELEALAAALGLDGRVSFTGQLLGEEAVRAQLDRADLFVLPSRTEGMPRALIEAMARGLPCIGSSVGGIPELLAAEDVVPPGNAVALAQRITEVLGDAGRQERMSTRNMGTAREYRDSVLSARRTAFYRVVRAATADRMRHHVAAAI